MPDVFIYPYVYACIYLTSACLNNICLYRTDYPSGHLIINEIVLSS